MLLSIVIPVYRVEKYVAECLNSIFSQKHNDVEIVIVDDGSPDNSMTIVHSLIEKKNNCRVVNQMNQGLSMARNVGMREASGDYIWFVDSDDWLLPNSIEFIFQCINDNPNVDVFSSVLEEHYESSGLIRREYDPPSTIISGKKYLNARYKQGAVQRFVFKRSFIEKNELNFYPGILHEDGLWGFKCLYLANEVMILNRSIYAYRIRNSGSIMSSVSIKSANDLLFIHKQLKEFMYERVAREDWNWYQFCIYNVIECIFKFSINIIDSKEFGSFYNANRDYLRQESFFLLRKKGCILYAIRMICFPKQYFLLKKKVKKFLGR